ARISHIRELGAPCQGAVGVAERGGGGSDEHTTLTEREAALPGHLPHEVGEAVKRRRHVSPEARCVHHVPGAVEILVELTPRVRCDLCSAQEPDIGLLGFGPLHACHDTTKWGYGCGRGTG